DLNLLGLGQDDHLGGGGVDATLRFGGWDTLDTMSTALVLEASIGASAAHLHYDLFVATNTALVGVEHLDGPALGVGVAEIQGGRVGGKDASLVDARAGRDGDDAVALVHDVLG